MKIDKTDINPLVTLMAQLRDSDNGCPWDKAQTHQSLVRMTFEETAELADAIAKSDSQNTCEELGDLLFHIVFYARIAEEAGDFNLQNVIDGIVEKMTRRHPHIFAGKVYANEAEQKADWHRIKAQEKQGRRSTLSVSTPANVSAIAQGIEIQKQLAHMGFDWSEAPPVFDKIHEELDELKAEIALERPETIAEEFGDVLFSVLNLGRKLGLDADMALRKANHKFAMRSAAMIERAGGEDTFAALSLDEKEALWVAVKNAC